MFKKDKFLWGVLTGLIPPILAFICVEILNFDFQISGKKHLLYIGSAIVNLILVRVYFKLGQLKAAEGVVFSMFVCGLLFYIFKLAVSS